jgi:putative flavoprotein involved in K+ transport
VLTEEADESTVTPGLFLAGPAVTHREAIFCFVYKFRQRFGVVAREIGDRLGVDTSPLEQLRAQQFLLDDLSCCELECAC